MIGRRVAPLVVTALALASCGGANKPTLTVSAAASLQEAFATYVRSAYLAAATLAGLALNSAAGIWWLDPVAALLIAIACVRAGRQTWRGEQCDCAACSPSVRA